MILSFVCQTAATRTWVRAWNQLLQLYAPHFGLRLQKTKSGMRLRLDEHYADITVDAGSGNLSFRLTFSEDCANELRGRAITLLGCYLALVERQTNSDKPVTPHTSIELNHKSTALGDTDTIRKWGEWALNEVYAQFPDQLTAVI